MLDSTIPPGVGPRRPPANVEAEQAFLGAVMANNKAIDRAPFLEPRHFADPTHGQIFAEMQKLIGERKIADSVTLKTIFEHTDLLKDVGGTAYLSQLLVAMVGIINAGDYARVVRDTWLRRELIDVGEVLVNAAYGQEEPGVDAEKIARDAVAMIDQLASGIAQNTTTSLDAAMDAALDAMEQARTNGRPPGISSGFRCIDLRLGGLEPGLVYVLAGRPGSGKSSLGHQIALNAARRGVGVLELSLEMSALQLGRRALSAASGVPLFVMKGGQVSQHDAGKLVQARKTLKNLPLTIDDAGGQTPRMIASKCRVAKRKAGNLGLVMLDHINLTRPDEDDAKHGATYAIEKASGTMLQIAKDCGVAVLLLTQLNRAVESRDDKRPGLADLRQSGALEQDCYAAGFLYREEYYLRNPPEQKPGESPATYATRCDIWRDHLGNVAGKAELGWQKVRDGEPGTDMLRFDGKTTSFSEDQT
jgi:replicative DNA helicase